MRALAKFAMRGPLQASGVAAVTTAVPLLFWVGAAVVGLVMLRLGLSQGLAVGIWALLPAIGWSWIGHDPTALAVLIQVMVMVAILRSTVSWEKTLLAGSVAGVGIGALLPVLYPDLLQQLVEAGTSFYRQYNPDVASQLGDQFEPLVRAVMNASMAGTYVLTAVAVCMLARSWQAGLFNPGAFQREFHDFRLSRLVAVGCVAVLVAGPLMGMHSLLLSWMAGIPLAVAGLALVHGLVSVRNMSVHWLVGFYIALVLLSTTLVLLLMVLAFVDSWLDVRGRVKPSDPAE